MLIFYIEDNTMSTRATSKNVQKEFLFDFFLYTLDYV